jgi:DNA-directed RNA polymerase subunit RPC12/RpoP
MDIVFNCGSCEQELSVGSDYSDTKINCPTCSTKLIVPKTTSLKVPLPQPKKKFLKNPVLILYHLTVMKLIRRRLDILISKKSLRFLGFFPNYRTLEQCADRALQSEMKLVGNGYLNQRCYKVSDYMAVLKSRPTVFRNRLGVAPAQSRIVFTGRAKDFPEFEQFISKYLVSSAG